MRVLSRQEIVDAIHLHKVWLGGLAGGERADFSRCNLVASTFGGVLTDEPPDLSRADFRFSMLQEADFGHCNLAEAKFQYADLTHAQFYHADLSGASFMEAELAGASFWGAKLDQVDFGRAKLDLVKADFWALLCTCPAEAGYLRDALIAGDIDGSSYGGECCCLVGTIARARECNAMEIPTLPPNADRPAERWFLAIRPGHTPENHPMAAIALGWLDEWLSCMSDGFARGFFGESAA